MWNEIDWLSAKKKTTWSEHSHSSIWSWAGWCIVTTCVWEMLWNVENSQFAANKSNNHHINRLTWIFCCALDSCVEQHFERCLASNARSHNLPGRSTSLLLQQRNVVHLIPSVYFPSCWWSCFHADKTIAWTNQKWFVFFLSILHFTWKWTEKKKRKS